MGVPSVLPMQLTEVLARTGRLRWSLVAVPLLCAGAAAPLGMAASPPSSATVVVRVVAPETGATAATITQAVESWRSTAGSAPVLDRVETSTGTDLSPEAVKAVRVGSSDLVELTVEVPSGTDAGAVTEALVEATQQASFATPVAMADARLGAARDELARALAARDRLAGRNGTALPLEDYRAAASELTQLRVAGQTSSTLVPDQLREARRAAEERLASLAGAVLAQQDVQDSVERARDRLAAAQADRDDVGARLDLATAPSTTTGLEVAPLPRRVVLVRWSGSAAVAGLALALAVLLALGLWRESRDRPPAAPARPALLPQDRSTEEVPPAPRTGTRIRA